MTACPGGCNSGWRAAGHRSCEVIRFGAPGLSRPRQGPVCETCTEARPRLGDPVWCTWDTSRIRQQVAELPDLAALYEAQVTGLHEQGRSPAHGGTTPSPSQTADDIDELDDMLLGHEMAYRADFNRRNPDRPMLPSPPRRGLLATVTDTTAAWLIRHLDDILASDMAVPFGEEIADKHREFMAKTRAGSGRKLGIIPCPQCDYMTLAQAGGYDGYVCGNCNRHVTRAEYDEDVTRHLERAS